jgi:hypothetical protein
MEIRSTFFPDALEASRLDWSIILPVLADRGLLTGNGKRKTENA